MKQFFLLISAILISATGFAKTNTSSSPTSLTKGSKQMESLHSAWKSHQGIKPGQSNEIEMVYGGEDVSARVLEPRTAAA